MTQTMPEYPFSKQFNSSSNYGGNHSPSLRSTQSTHEEISRIFNSALVATQVRENQSPALELQQLMGSPAFHAIMNAVRQVARTEGISERQAAEQIIRTFRKMDQIWSDYVYQEGVDRLRNQLGPKD